MGVFKVMKTMLAATSMSFLLAAMSLQAESRPDDVVYNDTCKMCPSMDRCYSVSIKVWCCDCDPGKYLLRNCSQISRPKETVCGNCPYQTYTSVPNHQEQCNASRSVESCIPLFNTVFKRGNASQDNRCVCKSGFFAKSPEIAGCKPHFKCPVGFGVKLPGTAAADTFCEYCKEGTCSNTESATDRCKPCNSSTPSAVPTSTPLPVTESSEQASIASPLSVGNQLGTGIAVGMGIMFFIILIAILSCLRWWKLKKRKKKKHKESERKRRAAEKTESRRPLMQDKADPPSKKSKPKKSGAEVVEPLLSDQTDSDFPSKKKSKPKKSGTGLVVETGHLVESKGKGDGAPVKLDKTDPENVVVQFEVEAKSLAIPDPVEEDAYKEDFRRAGFEVMYEPPETNAMFSAVVYPLLISENTPNPTAESVAEKVSSLQNDCVDYIAANADDFRDRPRPGDDNRPWEGFLNAMRGGAEPDLIIMLDALSHLIERPIQVYSPDGNLQRETPENFSDAEPILIGQVPRGKKFYYVTLRRISSTSDNGQDSQRVESLGRQSGGNTRKNIAQDGPAASDRGSMASSSGGSIPFQEPPVEPSQDGLNQSQESMQQRPSETEYAHSQQPSNATRNRQEPETSTEQREQQASLPPTGDQPSSPRASVSSDMQDTEQSRATTEQNPSLPESDDQPSSHQQTPEPSAQEHTRGEALPTNPKQASSTSPAAKDSKTKSLPQRILPPNSDDPSSPRTTSEPLAQEHAGGEARPTNPKQTSSSRPSAEASTKSRPEQNLPPNSDDQSSSYQAGHGPSIEPSSTESSSSTPYPPNIRPSIEDPSSETQPSSSYQPISNASSEGSSRSQSMSAPGSATNPSEARSGPASNADPESRPAAPGPTGQPASSRTPPAQHRETNVRVPTSQEPARSHAENLAVFRNRSDQTELARLNVGERVLFDALESTDYVEAMCNLFVDKIRTQDLKEMLRYLSLLSEIMIEDIENENRYDHKEMRRKFLKEMCFEQGSDLTPRILLNKAFSYRMRKPYDDLCKAFLQHLRKKQNL